MAVVMQSSSACTSTEAFQIISYLNTISMSPLYLAVTSRSVRASVYEGFWTNFSFLREGGLPARFALGNLDTIATSSSYDVVMGLFGVFTSFFALRPFGRRLPGWLRLFSGQSSRLMGVGVRGLPSPRPFLGATT